MRIWRILKALWHLPELVGATRSNNISFLDLRNRVVEIQYRLDSLSEAHYRGFESMDSRIKEILEEYKGYNDNASKLLEAFAKLEPLLEYPQLMRPGAPTLTDELGGIVPLTEGVISEKYLNVEKIKVIDKAVNQLHSTRSVIEGGVAIGSREIDRKAQALLELDRQIVELKNSRQRFVAPDATATVE